MESASSSIRPVVSKIFCAPVTTSFTVRNRPQAINGGGLIVTDSRHNVAFRVDGCGILGTESELILRGRDGESLLVIRRKGGCVQALSVYNQWKGYRAEYEGLEQLVFSMREPTSWVARWKPIRVAVEPRKHSRDWDFEIRGSFVERACSINDRRGNTVAKVTAMEGIEESCASKEIYRVSVQPGLDQAFVFGVIAVLDSIYGGSTSC